MLIVFFTNQMKLVTRTPKITLKKEQKKYLLWPLVLLDYCGLDSTMST